MGTLVVAQVAPHPGGLGVAPQTELADGTCCISNLQTSQTIAFARPSRSQRCACGGRRYRTTENGTLIDTKVNVTGLGPTKDAVELVKKLAALPEVEACFAQRVAEFSLGKALKSDPAGACFKKDIARRFEASGYNVRQLLLDLTQTDAFLYLPKDR